MQMKTVAKFTLVVFMFCIVLLGSCAYAEYIATEVQEGRYILVMVEGSGGTYGRTAVATKTPAIVLDTVLGIVWR